MLKHKTMSRSTDILFMTEYIKNVLYFAIVRQGKILKHTADTHYFSIDEDLLYENYYSDFGPLNLGCVYKYCKILNEKIKLYLNKQSIVHYTSFDPKKKTNAAYLLGCYGVLYLSLLPKDALKPLLIQGQSYRPFQDATQGDSNYTISLLDCLQGIARARDLNFFNFQDFNYIEYDTLDKIQGGDINWIVPAFIGPVDYCVSLYHPPEMYIDYFVENDVKIVIRLNKKLYDGNVFVNAGITHYNLFFPDGSCPPRHILFKFLQICEEISDGAIAVHCKAGLGRTGSLIGCYLIKHYRMTAHEAIAWMRICRPGSVIGHQQAWLEELEPWLVKQGNLYRRRNYHNVDSIPTHGFGVYSIAEKTRKQRPVIFSKSKSPPPPIQRTFRSDITPPARPRASKAREDTSKTTEKLQFEEKISTVQKSSVKRTSRDTRGTAILCRRGSGAGEPRVLRPSSKYNLVEQQQRTNVPSDKNYNENAHASTFYMSKSPIVKALEDTRNILMESRFYKNQKTPLSNDENASRLDSAIKIKQQHCIRGTNDCLIPGDMRKLQPLTFSPVSKGSLQSQQRRRLGRSPSPPSTRMLNEQSRATNTLLPVEVYKNCDSKVNLKKDLSNLKFVTPRNASVGAASLGARRDAPLGRRAPSVRSDERPLATQGDLLNSIKFQRSLRETLTAERIGNKFVDNPSLTPKEKQCIRGINSRTKPLSNEEHREKTACGTSKGFLRAQRPRSPKGRSPPPLF